MREPTPACASQTNQPGLGGGKNYLLILSVKCPNLLRRQMASLLPIQFSNFRREISDRKLNFLVSVKPIFDKVLFLGTRLIILETCRSEASDFTKNP